MHSRGRAAQRGRVVGISKRMPLIAVFVSALLVPLRHSTAQWRVEPAIDSIITRGINHTYNLEFPVAEKEFSEVVRLRPKDPTGHFFKAMVVWWQILIDFNNESRDQQFYTELEKVIDLCDELLDKNPNDVKALFFKGGSIGFRGRLRANRGSYIAAAYDGVRAMPIVRKAFEIDPDNYDVLLGIGIYNYYAEVIPNRYPFVKPVMVLFPSGNRKLGLQQLKEAATKGKYAAFEAGYFLLQSYQIYEKDYTNSLPVAEDLHRRFPNNPIFHRYLGRAYISLGFWTQGLAIFKEIEKAVEAGKPGYDKLDLREALYYFGRMAFTEGKLRDALKYFYRVDEISRELDKEGASGFMSMSNLTIGMIYDLQGKRNLAVNQYNKVLGMKEWEQTHKEARRYLQSPFRK